jgi:hypothetical protein
MFAGDLRRDAEKTKKAGKWRCWTVFGHVKVKEERNVKTDMGGWWEGNDNGTLMIV